MNILVDIGNTRIKWCIEKKGQLGVSQAISYKTVDSIDVLQQQWKGFLAPQLLAISSVGAKPLLSQIMALAKKNWPNVLIVQAKSSAEFKRLKNAYKNAEKLGVDRWLGLIALHHYYLGHRFVVDCGTAITIDYLDADNQHMGGVISSGIQQMKRSLFQETEDLDIYNQTYAIGLADYTESAIYTGTLFAATGLIEKTIATAKIPSTLILTGGDAQVIAQNLNISTIIEPNFVLKGLSLYCKEVVSQ